MIVFTLVLNRTAQTFQTEAKSNEATIPWDIFRTMAILAPEGEEFPCYVAGRQIFTASKNPSGVVLLSGGDSTRFQTTGGQRHSRVWLRCRVKEEEMNHFRWGLVEDIFEFAPMEQLPDSDSDGARVGRFLRSVILARETGHLNGCNMALYQPRPPELRGLLFCPDSSFVIVDSCAKQVGWLKTRDTAANGKLCWLKTEQDQLLRLVNVLLSPHHSGTVSPEEVANMFEPTGETRSNFENRMR